MRTPVTYQHGEPLAFGGSLPPGHTFETCPAVVLPIGLDRTTSYVPGTRNGPREILQASAFMELWDEEIGGSVHDVGIYTLPELELPFGDMSGVIGEIHRVASALLDARKFLVTLGGEHSITGPIVRAAAARHPGLSVLQIDAHADLRETYMGTPHNHACVMRRVLEHVPCTQVGIRSLSQEEAEAIPQLRTRLFYDFDLRSRPDWIEQVVESLGEPVYVTIDCDGFDPAVMPAVGTPEPGGLSWREMLDLLRTTFERRRVVACDVVEHCPIAGLAAPTFLCAKLVYKLLGYKYRDRLAQGRQE
jgi:agmatinase